MDNGTYPVTRKRAFRHADLVSSETELSSFPSLKRMCNPPHTLVFRGIKLQLGSRKFMGDEPINLENLEEYLETSVAKLSAQDTSFRKAISLYTKQSAQEDLPQKARSQIEAENIRFVDVVSTLVQLIFNFNSKNSNNVVRKFVFKTGPTKDNAFERQWKEHFEELKRYKSTFGHCNVSRTTKGFENLGNWLADQRRKLRRGKMTETQYNLLIELGVEFE